MFVDHESVIYAFVRSSFIARADPNVLLNKSDKLASKCRHKNKFTLKCFKGR